MIDLDFRTLFESVPGLYLILAPDRALTILAASDAYLRATMTERDAIVGRALFDVFPDNPSDPDATGTRNLSASIARAMATGKPDKMAIQKYDVRRWDGTFEERWWSPVNTPVLDGNRAVRYIIHCVEDVTELAHARREGMVLEERIAANQQRADAATRRANAYLASAVDSIQGAFALYDEHDRVVLVNSSFRQLLGGGSNGAILGRTFIDILDASIRAHVFTGDSPEALRERLIAHHRAPSETVELRTTSGRIFRLYEQATPEGGTVSLYVDMTVDVIREDELRKARIAAEAASTAKSEFLSSMSHELRTPLNAILGFTELLQRDRKEPPSPRQSDRLAHIHRGGEHLLRLINDILDLSRIESGRLNISSERVALSSVLAEVVSQLQPQAALHQIFLGQTATADDDAVVVADRTRLSQILMNFGSNSLKYGRPQGRAVYRVSRSPKARVRIALEDDGIGIPLDKQAKIFEPFQRAGQEAGPIEGTGIGLAISKRLAELMGGRIGFSSEPGLGSEFWIELAEHEAENEARSMAAPGLKRHSALGREGSRYLVLYIEDNPSNIALMRAVIDDLPRISMLTASTAEAGIDLIGVHRPDLVIMDVNLPGMSGIEAMRTLAERAETQAIPVIALSAAALPRDTARANSAGFRRYLTKPVNLDELTAAFEDILLAAIDPEQER